MGQYDAQHVRRECVHFPGDVARVGKCLPLSYTRHAFRASGADAPEVAARDRLPAVVRRRLNALQCMRDYNFCVIAYTVLCGAINTYAIPVPESNWANSVRTSRVPPAIESNRTYPSLWRT